jgi:hypothetical protein
MKIFELLGDNVRRPAFVPTVLGSREGRRRRSLRRVLATAGLTPVALATIGVATVAAQSTGHVRGLKASGPPCTPKILTIKNGLETDYCGPATATFTIGGKSFSFKNGYCSSELTTTVALTLGTLETVNGIEASGNAKKPYLSLSLTKGSSTQLLNAVYANGKKLSGATGMTATGTIAASGSSKGTFKGNYKGSRFSGSWNCHGVSVHES